MSEFPETRDSLILQVKDPANRIAWDEFAQIYRPVIYRIARSRGMQEADAQDLAQQVLMSVASAIGRWQQQDEDTRFRNWLSRVTRNAIIRALTRGPKDQAVGGAAAWSLIDEAEVSDHETETLITLEYRRELYLKAARAVRVDVAVETWKAFEMSVVQGVSVAETANQLGLSTGSVYAGRSRVMRRLREAVSRLEEEAE